MPNFRTGKARRAEHCRRLRSAGPHPGWQRFAIHDTYLVGCPTQEEAEARIKRLYPSEPNIKLYVSPLRGGDTKALKLARNEVREWQCDPQTP